LEVRSFYTLILYRGMASSSSQGYYNESLERLGETNRVAESTNSRSFRSNMGSDDSKH